MERLLHYVWKHRLFEPGRLVTNEGSIIEVIDPGLYNSDAGPDFFNAKVRIDGITWVGNVEMHVHASDWFTHGHDNDCMYDNVILHVVQKNDAEVFTKDGKRVMTVEMEVPENVMQNYNVLLDMGDYPRCRSIIPSISSMRINDWMSALLVERIEERAELVAERAEMFGGDWERAFFVTLARNFGFGKNGDEFEQWAKILPLGDVAHHRDNMFQVEAMFLGVAGLLEEGPVSHSNEIESDEYRLRLLKEYEYMCRKFGSSDGSFDFKSIPHIRWRFLRMRPQSFPHIRLVQLADLYCKCGTMLSAVVERCSDISELERLFDCGVSEYWKNHYTFGHISASSSKKLTKSSRHLVIINTVVPVLWAYGKHQQRQCLQEEAIRLLENMKGEHNHVTRQWEECGLKIKSAADSQAVIQLKHTRCDCHDCLRCRFGYDFLKKL